MNCPVIYANLPFDETIKAVRRCIKAGGTVKAEPLPDEYWRVYVKDEPHMRKALSKSGYPITGIIFKDIGF